MVNPIAVSWPKIEIFEIQDGGDRSLENRFLGHNSCPISATFCVRKQNGMPTKATWEKLQIFKIQYGGPPPFWKIIKLPYLNEKSSDFDEIWYTTSVIEPGCSHVTNNWFFFYLRWRRCHLENRFFGHNSLTDCPISAKFCMRKQHGMPTKATWQKLQIFKIQDGGLPPF